MEVILRISVNLVTGALLGIVFCVATLRLDHEDAFNRLFFTACRIVLLMLMLESWTCAMNGLSSGWVRWISKAIHVLLFSLPPALTYCWFLFTRALTGAEGTRGIRFLPIPLIPVAINGLAAVLSPFFNWTFVIDGNGYYHRGPFFLFFMGITYAYLLMGLFHLLKDRDKLRRGEFGIVLLFCLLPILGGVVQGLVYGPLLMWGCTACALIILYVYLQEQMIRTDSLTGAWSRGSFEHSVTRMMRGDGGEPFGLIYVDIDDFKSINDKFGHAEGDKALKALVGAIKPLLDKSDAIARLGGDEFAIYVRADGPEGLREMVKRIEAALEQYNRSSSKPYRLLCSIGAEMFCPGLDADVNALLHRVDRLMYE
ncbi:MAG TPA: diguanylate cyclase, partial [Clostridia bacterium]|nr:diguanylate cyclase [Clostridia bacterium]